MDIASKNFLVVKFGRSNEYNVIEKSWVRGKHGSLLLCFNPAMPTASILQRLVARQQPIKVAECIVDADTFEEATELIKSFGKISQPTIEKRASALTVTGIRRKKAVEDMLKIPSNDIVKVNKQSENPKSTISEGNNRAEPSSSPILTVDSKFKDFLIVKFRHKDEYNVIYKSWVRSKEGSVVFFSYPTPTDSILEKVRAREQLSVFVLYYAEYIDDTDDFEQATEMIKSLGQNAQSTPAVAQERASTETDDFEQATEVIKSLGQNAQSTPARERASTETDDFEQASEIIKNLGQNAQSTPSIARERASTEIDDFEQATEIIKNLGQNAQSTPAIARERASTEIGTRSKEVGEDLVSTPSKGIVRVNKQREYPNSTITEGNRQAEPNNIELVNASTDSVENMELVEPEDVAMDPPPQNSTSQESVENEGSKSLAQKPTSDFVYQMLTIKFLKQISEDIKNLAARIDQIETCQYQKLDHTSLTPNKTQKEEKKTSKKEKRKNVVKVTIPNKFGRNPNWTLKWKETDDRVVKLVPFCDVYVKEGVLHKLKESSKDASDLAIGLVHEVFHRKASKICSVRKINRLKPNWVLCSHALSVIIDLAVQHAKENEEDITKQKCEKDITKKLSEFRSKYKYDYMLWEKNMTKKKLRKEKTKAEKMDRTKELEKDKEPERVKQQKGEDSLNEIVKKGVTLIKNLLKVKT